MTPERACAAVDHYRVLDVDTQKDDQSELYTVLERIEEVLAFENCVIDRSSGRERRLCCQVGVDATHNPFAERRPFERVLY